MELKEAIKVLETECNKLDESKTNITIKKALLPAIKTAVSVMQFWDVYQSIGFTREVLENYKKFEDECIHKNYTFNSIIQARDEIQKYRELGTIDAVREAVEFKKYFDDMYGQGLGVANWHLNGDLEPFDTFYEPAIGG